MSRWSSATAAVATTELMAFTTGAFYVAGGAAALLSTVPAWGALDAPTCALVSLAVVAGLSGAALLVWGRRLPRVAFHVVVAAASAMLATGVVLSSSPTAAIAVAAIFVFCSVDVLYFFQGWQAVAQAGVLLLSVAGSLTARGIHPAHTAALVLVQVAVLVVIGRLVGRAADGSRDALTGLPNRRAFEEHLLSVCRSARRSGAPVSAALLDVDHFKAVNDRGGHEAGDALLSRLAQRWSADLPPQVVLFRQGGDEFALLGQGVSCAELVAVCARLHVLAVPATVSIGVCEVDPLVVEAVAAERAGGVADVVRSADAALYAAKAAGRACTRTAGPTGDSRVPSPR